MTQIQTMRINDIQHAGDTQIRVQPDMLAVNDYAKAMQDGDIFPPVDVFFDGFTYWLADGFHRIEAALTINLDTICATVHSGGKSDAILFAAQINKRFGVRLRTVDKQKMVKMFLENEVLSIMSNYEIANHCGVSEFMVRNHRKTIYDNIVDKKPIERKATRNGKEYTINTANIGKAAPEPEQSQETLFEATVETVKELSYADWMAAEGRTLTASYADKMAAEGRALTTEDWAKCPDEYLDHCHKECYGKRMMVKGSEFEFGVRGVYVCTGCGYAYPPQGSIDSYGFDESEYQEQYEDDDKPAQEETPNYATVIVEESEPTTTQPTSRINIINADSQYLSSLIDETVQLVVTSPPYNVGIEYDSVSDDLSTYIPFVTAVWKECYKVMQDGARIAVVVPFGIGRNPYVPFDCQIMNTLIDAGFELRGRIVWDKNTTGNRTSWGSWRLPSNPSIRDTTECIIVAHKGSSKLELPAGATVKDAVGSHTAWLADGDEFMALAQDHWVIAPESAQRVKHPAPFPVELAERLIKFYAYPGAHVLDPFGGSGTVALAAQKLGCDATLVEISQNYCELAKGRLNK